VWRHVASCGVMRDRPTERSCSLGSATGEVMYCHGRMYAMGEEVVMRGARR
jgi:hypothetical protein